MNICLFGSSSEQLEQQYLDAAYEMGRCIAEHGHTLIFGGGDKGVMGAAARGARSLGGAVIGIAPRFFNVNGILFEDCTEFYFTQTMAERKTLMEEKSEAFIAAPGGFGTLEEFFEVLTLKQLGRHNPAIAVLNTGGFFDPMMEMIRRTVANGFAKEGALQIFRVFGSPAPVLNYLERFDPNAFDVRHLKNL